ncbi:MAG: hypothetical protein ACI9VR_003576 [Cognaticolwellia sp.]|jgi:hypothetical protein
MTHFEREQDGKPRPLGDLAKVRGMVASGSLKGSDRVRVDGGPWAAARELPQLGSLFAPTPDLWSAWDEEDLDDSDTAQGVESQPKDQASTPWTPGPPEPPKPLPPPIDPASLESASPASVAPVSGSHGPASPAFGSPNLGSRDLGASDVGSLEPGVLPDHAVAPLPPLPVGKVIAFPGPKRAPLRSSAAPRYETTPLLVHEGLEPLAPVLEKTEEKLPGRFQTRHYWMIASILATGFLTMLMVVWVRGTARWTSDAPLGQVVAQSELPVLPEPAPELVNPESKLPIPEPALSEVVAELRGRIPLEARPLGLDPSGMEDVFFVELRRVVDLDRVQIKVLEFDAADRASRLELKVVLQEEGAQDLSRSFTAIGLVVGKYVDREGLDLPTLKVLVPTDEGTLEKAFDGQRSAAFWRGELGAQAYLRGE